jgi:alkylation response protein AidB-like acyl-CoA dehydrogenase
MEQLHAKNPVVGADIAALAYHTLADLLERARVRRLTRNQHILLRIGEWIAWAECAASMARRANRAVEGSLHEKADQRFDANSLAAMSRIFARDAAMKVAQDGFKWILGADELSADEIRAFEKQLNLSAIYQTQSSQLADMDIVCKEIYSQLG